MVGDHILAIDNGTQSVRALLFDLRGNLVAKSRVPLEPYFSDHPGWAEQHPEYFWTSLCQACQGLWHSTDIPKETIAGVALTTQRATVVNVDRQGKPLRPAILWLDQRRTLGLKPVRGLWGLAFRLAGASETVAYLQAEAEANWIRTHQPEIWEQTHKYLLLSGYLTYRLTGRFVDSVGCQVGYLPFDYKKLAWAGPRDWKWQAVPMDPALLPGLVPPAGQLGEITPEAAINPGNSGGPLLDMQGRIIGINSQIISPSRANAGIGFAIPVNTVKLVVPELITHGHYRHPWIGAQFLELTPQRAQILAEAGVKEPDKGLLLLEITPGSAADKAGLRGGQRIVRLGDVRLPLGGDVLMAINGQEIASLQDLTVYLEMHTQVGAKVQVTVLRDGQRLIVPLTLQERQQSR